MRPWLLHGHVPGVGQVALSSWFTLLVVGLAVALWVATREARRGGDSGAELLRTGMIGVLGGLVGSRLGHLLTANRDEYLADPMRLLAFWEGGMVLYGGLILGTLTALLWMRHRSMPLLRSADATAPALAVGIAVGRLGCLLAGCCYGRPIDWGTGIEWPWGVVFLQGVVPEVLRGVALHPTQVYSSLGALLLFGALHALRARQRFDGQTAAAFLLAYPIVRSTIELFRLDLERGFLLPDLLGETISTSQALSLPVFALGVAVWLIGRRAARADGTLGLAPRAARDARTRHRIEQALAA